jgi:hypothetical protein
VRAQAGLTVAQEVLASRVGERVGTP